MTEAYFENDYIYAVARVRGAELGLLDEAALDQLAAVSSAEDVLQLLREKNYGLDDEDTADTILQGERKKLWDFIDEIVPDKNMLEVFRISADYNNVKAAIKESVLNFRYPGIYIQEGNVDAELVKKAVQERNYRDLPGDMPEIAEAAHDVFLRTGDGQLCDIMVDKACMEQMLKAAEESGNEVILEYAQLYTAAADIKLAVRAQKTGKNREFLQDALCDVDILNMNQLMQAAQNSFDAICSFLESTDFSEGAGELRKSPAAFEKYCDDLLMDRMRAQLYNSFGFGPIAAYILAKENEMKTVRIILSGKQNGFSEAMIRERMRESYV